MAKRYVAVYFWHGVDAQLKFSDDPEELIAWVKSGLGEGFEDEDSACVIDLEAQETIYEQCGVDDEAEEEGEGAGFMQDLALGIAVDEEGAAPLPDCLGEQMLEEDE
jgi:hypothetical protein